MQSKISKIENPLKVAEIGSAVGVKGEVRVRSFLYNPMNFMNYKDFYSSDGQLFSVVSCRHVSGYLIVQFSGVNERNAARSITGTELFIDRTLLPDPEDNEFYHCDLIGLRICDETQKKIGFITAVHNFGAGDILEFSSLQGEKSFMIPFTRQAVLKVDISSACIFIDSLAAGLASSCDLEVSVSKNSL